MLFFIFVQMPLDKYISDLLYRYECVIVPQFGGFISNAVSARVNHFTHTFYPPSKQLTFNSHLTKNDGLLANYIAASEHISYGEAKNIIADEVALWKHDLEHGEMELERVGTFRLNTEGNTVFEPNNEINYLTSSFGLSTYVSPAVKRLKGKHVPVIPLERESTSKRKTPVLLKYAAAATVAFAMITVGWKEYQKFEYNKLVAQAEMQQDKVNRSIQEATFIISNPLPAITLNVAKKTSNYHIIAGAFREPGNAEKKTRAAA